jgi:spore coat protein A, manganese oxidase
VFAFFRRSTPPYSLHAYTFQEEEMKISRRAFLALSATAGAAALMPDSRTSSRAVAASMAAQKAAEKQGISLLDPVDQPKFAYEVPNALAPSFIFRPQNPRKNHYKIGMFQFEQALGLVDPESQQPLKTTVWGYGDRPNRATFPGRTFQVQKDQPITVRWENKLERGRNQPLPHLLPVDTSLHWAYGELNHMQGTDYSIAANGVPVVPHLHGGHTESDSDGLPEYWFSPGWQVVGPRWVKKDYLYDNSQEAGTVWYHDHALGITRLNVYAGLAGFYIIRDERDTGQADNPLGLPAYPYEAAFAIQDRMFSQDGQLFYPAFPGEPAWEDFITDEGLEDDEVPQPSVLAEFFGDHILVNGVIWPKMAVEPRHYRIRLLNGSDSRFYVLQLRAVASDATDLNEAGELLPFYQIGVDNGLLPRPVELDMLILGPGERADLVLPFGDPALVGKRIILENIGPDAPFGGDIPADEEDLFEDRQTDRIMAFDVSLPLDESVADTFDPEVDLRPGGVGYTLEGPVARVRKLALFEGTDEYGRLQPLLGVAEPTMGMDGQMYNRSLGWFEAITENPGLGDIEEWEIYNATMDAHPIHVHLTSFEILGRAEFHGEVEEVPQPQHNHTYGEGGELEIEHVGDFSPPEPNEVGGPKDTVLVYPHEVARIRLRFDRPGRYVWHCHILSHEDHEMMRPYQVGA